MSDTFSDVIHENPLRVAEETCAQTAKEAKLKKEAKNRAKADNFMVRWEGTFKVGRSLQSQLREFRNRCSFLFDPKEVRPGYPGRPP